MKKKIYLFNIGDDYYDVSGSIMSSLYEVDTNIRYDWGFVQRDLSAGHEVNIRPATRAEISWAKQKLGELLLEERASKL